MKHEQLVILSVFRDVDCANFCVVTPRGLLSVCALKFFRKGSNGAILSVDISDETGEFEKRKVGQSFMLRLFEFIEDRIFREFHDSGSSFIHSLEISWGSMGLEMVKYYDKQLGAFFYTPLFAPASLRIN